MTTIHYEMIKEDSSLTEQSLRENIAEWREQFKNHGTTDEQLRLRFNSLNMVFSAFQIRIHGEGMYGLTDADYDRFSDYIDALEGMMDELQHGK